MTGEVLFMYWQNTVDGYCDGKEQICEKVRGFLADNFKWVKRQIRTRGRKSAYWHQVGLFYAQLRSLVSGYNKRMPKNRLEYDDILWMNVFGDLEDLEQVFSHRLGLNHTGHVLGSGSCSALIKVLGPDYTNSENYNDVYASHDTWNSYQSMLRILKNYKLNYKRSPKSKKVVPGNHMTFSSYPGVIYSGDDFTTSPNSGLHIMETTIGNNNASLWQYVKPEKSVLEGIRATVANRLATSGKEWTKIFAYINSGTYNNQWMVLDFKKFSHDGDFLKQGDFLWVLEQLPGHVHLEDVTHVLREQGYWASYNTPYFKDIFNASGGPAMVSKFGDWFSFEKTPRALIFKRDQGNVRDLDSMTRLMRYNNFQHDPLSACRCDPPFSAENAISARNDLNPKGGTYPFGALGHRSHGGTDMKLVNFKLWSKGQFVAAGGPTYDDLPAFQWSKTDFEKNTPHFGHPDKWEFKPIVHEWTFH